MLTIYLHELQDQLRSLRFQVSLLVLLLFFVANGVTIQQSMWGVRVTELMNYQGLGALLAFVALGLWVGREHLTQV
ncbi:MAG: hypothetical protein HOH74_17330, partial [Gemmatimonadetes bacterium]|nr:hypothetical protein [Gemmatimonadota bacterium]